MALTELISKIRDCFLTTTRLGENIDPILSITIQYHKMDRTLDKIAVRAHVHNRA
jgi:hypothetical protein